MSGPIIRKYGFPNFEKIFGKKDPAHGSDDPDATTAAAQIARAAGADQSPTEPPPKPETPPGDSP